MRGVFSRRLFSRRLFFWRFFFLCAKFFFSRFSLDAISLFSTLEKCVASPVSLNWENVSIFQSAERLMTAIFMLRNDAAERRRVSMSHARFHSTIESFPGWFQATSFNDQKGSQTMFFLYARMRMWNRLTENETECARGQGTKLF